jgi:hypothetical protein
MGWKIALDSNTDELAILDVTINEKSIYYDKK